MIALLVASMLAQVPPAPACDPACERAAAEQLFDEGNPRQAIERLRAALSRFPDDPTLQLLLARGYLLDDNLFWAERTLSAALAREPDDTEVREWLACVHIRQGDPDLALADLAAEHRPVSGPDLARWNLLEAFNARVAGESALARAALAAVPRKSEVYQEDREVWRSLHRRTDPWWLDPITGNLELGLGGTSNALAGAPTDPGASGGLSGLATIEAHGRLVPPVSGATSPILDLDLIGDGLSQAEYRELSNLDVSARVGGLFTGSRHRLVVGYRAEMLFLDQTPSLYAEAHRLELEIEGASGWALLAGAGHRAYQDELRTRWEGDVSVGGPLGRVAAVPVVAGAAVRLGDANSPAYDQRGVAAVVVGRFPVGRGWSTRLALSGALDDYPHSGGLEGLLVFGTTEKRRDLLGRIAVGVWTPRRGAARVGLEWQYTRRDSTANDRPGYDFSYREQRAMVLLHLELDADPWAPRAVRPPGHVPLEWGLGADGGEQEERILELLRQDEDLQRGCGCAVR
jgi:tetratricopeptide (TPR) repeat protein